MKKLFNFFPEEILDEIKKLNKINNTNGVKDILNQASNFYDKNTNLAKYMFGYPANITSLSLLTQYLLIQHYTAPLSNNCGDINEVGNYSMDTKHVEKQIIELFAKKFEMGDDYWGYVTSGGSESNSCAISLAFSQNPNGILYFSEAAHYSIKKYAVHYKTIEIPVLEKDILDVDFLCKEIYKNYKSSGSAANLLLTHGTTKYGACDDIDTIVAFLRKHKIPYYLHMDAALFGGVPNNQIDAPLLLHAKERGVNSVSVSFHKYLGFPDVKSIFVATSKPDGKEIQYIGQRDTTISGSRSIPAYALYNHLVEQLYTLEPDTYRKNIIFFEEKLKENNIDFYRAPNSNIFVINAPSVEIALKYQLSVFDEIENGKPVSKAHIVIFPNHDKDVMVELIKDL